MSDLVIVESPAKAKTIKKYLGGNYEVVASMGHVRDLPKSKMGIDFENNFEPQYVDMKGKEDVIKELKKYAKKANMFTLQLTRTEKERLFHGIYQICWVWILTIITEWNLMRLQNPV